MHTFSNEFPNPHDSVKAENLSHASHAPYSHPAIQHFDDRLYVIAVVSNPVRYHSRYRLYRNFEKHVLDAGAVLYTVEMAFGGRAFEITSESNPCHIQVRSDHELWHKENLINIGISRLPAKARYIAWIDADVQFACPDWAQETVHQLQHFDVVQMFSHAVDLDPEFRPYQGIALSWIESLNQGLSFKGTSGRVDKYGSGPTKPICKSGIKGCFHSGLAWSARRSALDKLGGLIDIAILGSADRNMAAGLLGFMEDTIDPTFSPEYKNVLLEWQSRAERAIRRNVGMVPGLISHSWHGKKVERGYTSRWKILSKHQFNPHKDIYKDSQGLWQLADFGDKRGHQFRDDIRNYFRSRNEDSIDL